MFKQQVTVAPTMILWWYDWGVFLLTFVAIALIGWVFYSSGGLRPQPGSFWCPCRPC